MASSLDGVFPTTLQENILESKVLVVGAGGIGCEILKNLVMSGFPDIEIIDLDSIDLSNLNRQFLFHKEHVGKSKAEVARESALKFNPNVKIKAYHDSIFNTEYGVDYFEKFNIVLNALDNRQARNHVNRMCLNAGVPLIESGTAGYNGQVELIQKGLTQCYECTPKATQKTFPGCTIRNTPSEPIHCIVWAKHLFNQLFGETVDDEDISPDYADPEAGGESNADEGNVKRVNTRLWAEENGYDAETLFNKFFYDDINYLLSMSNLWKTRKPPVPIKWDSILLDENKSDDEKEFLRQYHKIWTFAECAAVFADSLDKLKSQSAEMPANEKMIWDKDDNPAMDFVAACANIRAYIFEIGMKSRFEIKSMAGNIIPAIATTNAITAGIVVMHAFNALKGQFDKCKSVYIRHRPNPRNQLLVPEKLLNPPNPKCYVCAPDPAIHLKVDTNKVRICDLRDEILIRGLNMVNPDVIIDAKSVIVISSEEGETEANDEKTMSEMAIVSGTLLKVDDFFQNYNLSIIVIHMDAERDGPLFEIIADKDKLKPQEEPAAASDATNGAKKAEEDLSDGPSTSKKSRIEVVDEDDDLCLIEDDDDVVVGEKADEATTFANDADGTETSNATSNSSSSEKTEITSTQPKATANSSSSAGTKRKPPSAGDDDENSEDGPTTTKRNKPDEDEDVDEDEDDDDDVTIID